jgi:hypothetical protein
LSRFLVTLAVLAGAIGMALWWIVLPAAPSTGPTAPPEAGLGDSLLRHVRALAEIGPRHAANPESLEQALRVIEAGWRDIGIPIARRPYRAGGRTFVNLEATLTGRVHPDEYVLVGAHYDSVPSSPGADDNATGVAALIELARLLKAQSLGRSVRFVAFANEELPLGDFTPAMGSLRYAQELAGRRERLVAMLSLESIGYYSDAPGSQKYPAPLSWFYPEKGDFLAFVGNLASRALAQRALRVFRGASALPAEGIAAPELIRDIRRSDQAPFWDIGVPALMVTDTAPFRHPGYHTPRDTPDRLDGQRFAQAVSGLRAVVLDLAR